MGRPDRTARSSIFSLRSHKLLSDDAITTPPDQSPNSSKTPSHSASEHSRSYASRLSTSQYPGASRSGSACIGFSSSRDP